MFEMTRRRAGRGPAGQLLLFAASVSFVLVGDPGRAQTIYQNVDKFDGSTLYYTEQHNVALEGGSFFLERLAPGLMNTHDRV